MYQGGNQVFASPEEALAHISEQAWSDYTKADYTLEQWHAAKSAASDAIVGTGGTITHHHAVGRDHAPWLRAEVGDVGLDLIRAAKQRLDPVGIMNPGKLLPG